MSGIVSATEKAHQQYSYITLAQAESLGVHRNTVGRLVRAGLWIRDGPSLFRLAGASPTWRGRMMAACLRAGPEAMISHRSAATLWGLEGFNPPWTLDVTVPPWQRPRIPKVHIHRRDGFRRAVHDGIPVTTIPETILDLCAVSANEGIPLRAFHDVRRRRLVSTPELERCLAEHSKRRTAGIGLYRDILVRWLGKTPPGNSFATEVLDLLVAAGLPEPVAEFWVTLDGRRYRIDLAYPALKIAIECIGKIGHLNEKAFEEDPVRSNDFALDGWLQLQVTYRRKEEKPESVVAEVAAALAVRGAA